MNSRAPSRCRRAPLVFATVTTRSSSVASNISPVARRTGVSTDTTETRVATRPVFVVSNSRCKSSALNVAWPGASGIIGNPLSVCTQSPLSW